jgi:hypothetical protein
MAEGVRRGGGGGGGGSATRWESKDDGLDDVAPRAAVRAQALCRRFLARMRVARLAARVIARHVDEASGREYFVNQATWESSWSRPCVLPAWAELEARAFSSGREAERKDITEGESELSQVLAEPPPAGLPATVEAMVSAWRTVLPVAHNPHDAVLRPLYVYSSKRPQRCLVLESSDLRGALAAAGEPAENHDEWELSLAFLAFSAPVPDSTKYSVWSRHKPYRSRLKAELKADVPSRGGSAVVSVSVSVSASASAADEHWSKEFDFWAFYAPVQSAFCINVQEVPNPVRFRVTESSAERGGWSQTFSFFAYPLLRVAVLDAVATPFSLACNNGGAYHAAQVSKAFEAGKKVSPWVERSKLREFPLAECGELHPDVESCEYEGGTSPDASRTVWCRRFELIGLKNCFPGAVEYRVLGRREVLSPDTDFVRDQRTRKKAVYENDTSVLFPHYKLAQEGDGETKGWDELCRFLAFTLPLPGTTRFYFMVARSPRRFRVSLQDHLGGGWQALFCFFAYSTRAQDRYTWARRGGGWSALPECADERAEGEGKRAGVS